jgi:hypothetical protein
MWRDYRKLGGLSRFSLPRLISSCMGNGMGFCEVSGTCPGDAGKCLAGIPFKYGRLAEADYCYFGVSTTHNTHG